jgi:hypothetical protein
MRSLEDIVMILLSYTFYLTRVLTNNSSHSNIFGALTYAEVAQW